MAPDKLYAAILGLLEAQAFQEEQKKQPRNFSKNERIAFKLGFLRGTSVDVHRADSKTWELAAKKISMTSKNDG